MLINNEIIIKKAKDEYGWLLCMSPYPVKYNGLEFRTVEALFQWLRFGNYPKVQQEIIEQKSPMGAKMKARKNRDLLQRGVKWIKNRQDFGEW